MTAAHKMQIKKRARSSKRSGRKTGDLPIVTTELEPRTDLQVRADAEPHTGARRARGHHR